MPEGLIISRGREILLIDVIHPVLLPDILIDKDGGKVMIVSTDIPADGGFRPWFFPLRIIGEAKEEPKDGDKVDDA